MLHVSQEGRIVTITIESPPFNTLNPNIILELTTAVREWSMRQDVRLMILTGQGDRSFLGGVDIGVFANMDPEGAERFITSLHHCCLSVRQSDKIVIAAINGYALGGGLELAAACDLRIASDRARFGMPEVKVGLPSVIEAAYLPRLIGLGRAAELVYVGDMIDAAEAERIGLVNKVVPHNVLLEAARQLAEKILASGPTALVLQKRLVNRWMEAHLSDAVEAGIASFRACFETGEPNEGARAFLKKRKPVF